MAYYSSAINPPDIIANVTAQYPTADEVITTITTTTTSITTTEQLFEGYPSGLLTFASVTSIIFILIGVPGNLITIIALARCKKVRNATAVFIINLSLSDLLFCCFNLPLATSTYWNRAWRHSDLLCRLFPLLRYGLTAVSLFNVLAITLNRYVMIGHPRIYPRMYRHKYLGMMVAATWIMAFTALLPTWRGVWGTFGMDLPIGSCSILPDKNNNSPKDVFFLLAFVVPCVAIITCYARIFYIVRKTAMRSHEPPMITTNGSMYIHPVAKTTVTVTTKNNNNAKPGLDRRDDDTDKQLLDHDAAIAMAQRKHSTDGADDIPLSTSARRHAQTVEADGNSGLSSSLSSNNIHPRPITGPKIFLKFIDSSVDSDLPPSLSRLRVNSGSNNELKTLSASDRNMSSVSISKNVEFREDVDGGDDDYDDDDTLDDREDSRNGSCEREVRSCRKKRRRSGNEVDSAVEESTSSSENNQQIYHIRSENNCNRLLSVHVEPSSSSGIDLPLDEESPPRRPKRSFATSLRRIKRPKDKGGGGGGAGAGTAGARKHSTMNTSGASILYPGRMTAKDRRLLKMIMVILVSFIMCYLPITTTKIVRSIREVSYMNIIGNLLVYLTTCINPIIYVVMSSEYRQAYVNLLMCRVPQTTRHGVRVPKEPVHQQLSQRT